MVTSLLSTSPIAALSAASLTAAAFCFASLSRLLRSASFAAAVAVNSVWFSSEQVDLVAPLVVFVGEPFGVLLLSFRGDRVSFFG